MKAFWRALLSLGAVTFVTACGRSSSVQAAETYEQEACIKCTDQRCADQAAKKFSDAIEGKPVSASSDEAEIFSKAKAKAVACTSTLPTVSSAPSAGSAATAGPAKGRTK